MVSCSVFLPPHPAQWYGSPSSTPFPSICKLLAAFLRSSLVFARSLQHVWLTASHLLGTCYLLDDLRSTHTPSKYLRATYSHIYMCYVLCIYFLFTTCVLSQHYMGLTYTVPTIHSNDTIHTIHTVHTIRTLTVHTIPIIPIMQTTHTIHMKHNCHTSHTYNTKHTCHTYHIYLTMQTFHTHHSNHTYPYRTYILSYQTYHTQQTDIPYLPSIQYHTPTTPQGEGGPYYGWHIYIYMYVYIYIDIYIHMYIYIYLIL